MKMKEFGATGGGGHASLEPPLNPPVIAYLKKTNLLAFWGSYFAAAFSSTLEMQKTNFTCNKAKQGGAIDVGQQAYLHSTYCVFKDNHGEHGGAIYLEVIKLS